MEALGGHLSPFLCGLPEAAQSLVHDPILPSKPADGGNSFSRATSLWLWLASVPCSGSGHSHITRGTRLLSWIQVCTPAARMTSASLILSCPVTFTSSQVLGTRSWALGGGCAIILPTTRVWIYSQYFHQLQPYSFDSHSVPPVASGDPYLLAPALVRSGVHPNSWMAPFPDTTGNRNSRVFSPRPCPHPEAGVPGKGTHSEGTAVVSQAFPWLELRHTYMW